MKQIEENGEVVAADVGTHAVVGADEAGVDERVVDGDEEERGGRGPGGGEETPVEGGGAKPGLREEAAQGRAPGGGVEVTQDESRVACGKGAIVLGDAVELKIAQGGAGGGAGWQRVGEEDVEGSGAEREGEGEGREVGIGEEFEAEVGEGPAGEDGEAEVVLARVKAVVRVVGEESGGPGEFGLPAVVDFQEGDEVGFFGANEFEEGAGVGVGGEDVDKEDFEGRSAGVDRDDGVGRGGADGPEVEEREEGEEGGPARAAKQEADRDVGAEEGGVLGAKRGELGEEGGAGGKIGGGGEQRGGKGEGGQRPEGGGE